jgi:hypothetical protein
MARSQHVVTAADSGQGWIMAVMQPGNEGSRLFTVVFALAKFTRKEKWCYWRRRPLKLEDRIVQYPELSKCKGLSSWKRNMVSAGTFTCFPLVRTCAVPPAAPPATAPIAAPLPPPAMAPSRVQDRTAAHHFGCAAVLPDAGVTGLRNVRGTDSIATTVYRDGLQIENKLQTAGSPT